MDFTLTTYRKLLDALMGAGYAAQTFAEFVAAAKPRAVVLRHDVDRLPGSALTSAIITHEFRIKATYFFRIVPGVWDEKIMAQIMVLGHEIAYHYEDLTITKGDYESAIQHFARNLARFRTVYPLKTICMHGSPLSKWDNRLLWTKYDYRDFGIIGEPYFDIDYDKVAYYTDTGRRWDGEAVSVRDKPVCEARGGDLRWKSVGDRRSKEARGQRSEVGGSRGGSGNGALQKREVSGRGFPRFHSTHEIIAAAKNGALPQQIMFTFHPQRWTNNLFAWVKELVWQNVKNCVKRQINR
ncbi:hypothetical protein JXO59_07130 [candidate division KSB1 bacterium]|nr:hypothetical protein [candidate division KSB1 bacterium]